MEEQASAPPTPVASVPASAHQKTDEEKLHELGYAQELKRRMSGFNNFAVSFTIISILSGCLTLYYYGLLHGGPPVMVWGWLGVGVVVLFAGMSMAEICSAYPTAGGLYYWSSKLGSPARAARSGPGSPAGSTCSARSPSPPASASVARCLRRRSLP